MSSPFFTQPRNTDARQQTIPMGMHHVCPTCGNSYICDSGFCRAVLTTPCASCSGDPRGHEQQERDRNTVMHVFDLNTKTCFYCGCLPEEADRLRCAKDGSDSPQASMFAPPSRGVQQGFIFGAEV